MEVKQINNFSELLLKLIDNNYDENEIDTYNQTLEYNLYLALLAFSNFKYNEDGYDYNNNSHRNSKSCYNLVNS